MERLTFAVIDSKVEGRTLSFTAHVFGQVTTDGRKHAFAPDAFNESIAGGRVKSFAWHGEDKLLASQKAGTLRLSVEEGKLKGAMDLPETTAGNDLRALAERGEDLGMSFSVIPGESRLAKGVRTFSKAELVSVDPVAMPAFEGTSVMLNSSQEAESVISQITKIRARTLAKLC